MASTPHVFVCRTPVRRWLLAHFALTLVLIGAECAVAPIRDAEAEAALLERLLPDDDAYIPPVPCPRQCVCVRDSHVQCSGLVDNMLPEDLSNETDDLRLDGNGLTKMSEFFPLPNLKTLTMSHNRLKRIFKNDLEMFPSLYAADFSFNQVRMPHTSAMCPGNYSLRRLNLNSNKIKTLHRNNLEGCSNLLHLTIAHNNISQLEKGFLSSMTQLEYLDLSNNNLVSIDGLTFGGLKSLKHLILKDNRLQNLSDGAFYELVSLENLQLFKNHIPILKRGWMYLLPSLKHLNLSTNSISHIQKDAFEDSKELTNLDLSSNILTSIGPRVFNHLSKLKRLDLSSNDMSDVDPTAFDDLSSLESLILKHNMLAHVVEDPSGTFSKLSSLLMLDLSSNDITSFTNKSFEGLTRLTNLLLKDNPIKTMGEKALSTVKVLRTLEMNSHHLLCYCNLDWLPTYLVRYGLKPDLICEHPRSLNGSQIRQLAAESLPCVGYPIPTIIEGPAPLESKTGDNVTLACRASSPVKELMTFIWKKNNVVIATHKGELDTSTDSAATEWQQHSLIHLGNIGFDNSGFYQCIVSNGFGTNFSAKSKLDVYSMPVFSKVPKNLTAITGTSAKLECEAHGEPKPKISWVKERIPFLAAAERRMHVMPDSSSFFILTVKPGDSGKYKCYADNKAGKVYAEVYLEVLDPPRFAKPIENKDVMLGETAVIECMAEGLPKPKLVWTRDGQQIEKDDRHFLTGEDQLLIIVNAGNTDSGLYTCELSNSAGKLSGTSRLTVIQRDVYTNEKKTKMFLVCAAVVGVLVTSMIWVIMIYALHKRRQNNSMVPRDLPMVTLNTAPMVSSQPDADSSDSGHGDSTEQARDYSSGSDIAAEELEEEQPIYGNVAAVAPTMLTFRPYNVVRNPDYVSREEMAACIPRMV
ncbi:leucine-rich repeats and immunoglobulin-like domains protein 1 [Cloeon dipterum]|uniref:leucine-rich repeats and immunoglobulin-like domains protein 1 n=1 Tax=Cloeon dipterum TaxID=197152 RepID=UPI00321FF2E4